MLIFTPRGRCDSCLNTKMKKKFRPLDQDSNPRPLIIAYNYLPKNVQKFLNHDHDARFLNHFITA